MRGSQWLTSLAMTVFILFASCSKDKWRNTFTTVFLGSGSIYYLESCGYEAFKRQGARSDYDILPSWVWA